MELTKKDLDHLKEALEVMMAVRQGKGESNRELFRLKAKINTEIAERLSK